MPKLFSRLVNPWYPSTALGFEKGTACVVQLERGRNGGSSLKRAATLALPDSLINPSFEEPNISDIRELAAAVTDLATSAGLLRQKRWSVALPEASVPPESMVGASLVPLTVTVRVAVSEAVPSEAV